VVDNVQVDAAVAPVSCVGADNFDGDDSDDDSLAMGPGVTAPTPSTAVSRPGVRAGEQMGLQQDALLEVQKKLEEAALADVEEGSDKSSKALGHDDDDESHASTRDRSWDPGSSEHASRPQVTEIDTSGSDHSAVDGAESAVAVVRGLCTRASALHHQGTTGDGLESRAEASLVASSIATSLSSAILRRATCCTCNQATVQDGGDLVEVVTTF